MDEQTEEAERENNNFPVIISLIASEKARI